MKAAVVNMTKSLARALAPIRVNAISPGLVDTELTKEWKDYRKKQIDLTPLKILTTTTDVANEALHLILSDKSYKNTYQFKVFLIRANNNWF